MRHLEDFQAFYKSHRVRLVHRPAPEWASAHSSRPAAAHASTDRSDWWGTCDTSLWHCRCVDPPTDLWFAVRRPCWWCLDRQSHSPALAFELRTPQASIVWEFAGCDSGPMRSTSRRRCCWERSTERDGNFCMMMAKTEEKKSESFAPLTAGTVCSRIVLPPACVMPCVTCWPGWAGPILSSWYWPLSCLRRIVFPWMFCGKFCNVIWKCKNGSWSVNDGSWCGYSMMNIYRIWRPNYLLIYYNALLSNSILLLSRLTWTNEQITRQNDRCWGLKVCKDH